MVFTTKYRSSRLSTEQLTSALSTAFTADPHACILAVQLCRWGYNSNSSMDERRRQLQGLGAIGPRARASWVRATAYLAAGNAAQALQVGVLVRPPALLGLA